MEGQLTAELTARDPLKGHHGVGSFHLPRYSRQLTRAHPLTLYLGIRSILSSASRRAQRAGACGLTTTDATDVAYFPTLAFSSSNQFVTIISCDWAPGL